MFFSFILMIAAVAVFWPLAGLVWLVIEVRAREPYADPIVVFCIWMLGTVAIVPLWIKGILPLFGA